jgi:hypothetical protein
MIFAALTGFHRFDTVLPQEQDGIFYTAVEMIECMVLHAVHVIINGKFIAIPFMVHRQTAPLPGSADRV